MAGKKILKRSNKMTEEKKDRELTPEQQEKIDLWEKERKEVAERSKGE